MVVFDAVVDVASDGAVAVVASDGVVLVSDGGAVVVVVVVARNEGLTGDQFQICLFGD